MASEGACLQIPASLKGFGSSCRTSVENFYCGQDSLRDRNAHEGDKENLGGCSRQQVYSTLTASAPSQRNEARARSSHARLRSEGKQASASPNRTSCRSNQNERIAVKNSSRASTPVTSRYGKRQGLAGSDSWSSQRPCIQNSKVPPSDSLGQAAVVLEYLEERRAQQQACLIAQVAVAICHSTPQKQMEFPSGAFQLSADFEASGLVDNSGRITAAAMEAQVRALCASPNDHMSLTVICSILKHAVGQLWERRHEPVAHIVMPKPSCKPDSSAPQVGGRHPRLIIVGDLRGQLKDLLWIFRKHGLPSSNTVYLFNGGLVDRAAHSVEVMILILGFMVACPSAVHLNRGHHEDARLNCGPTGGFYDECILKYGRLTGRIIYEKMKQIFSYLPLATIVEERLFVIHGGLSRCASFLNLLEGVEDRCSSLPLEPRDAKEQAMFDALWSDPCEQPGISPSLRGTGVVRFGPDVTRRFLETTGFSVIIRSHELPANLDGFSSNHKGMLATVFSASNYCGSTGNRGAVLVCRHERHNGQNTSLVYDVDRYFAPEIGSGTFWPLAKPYDGETPVGESRIISEAEIEAARHVMQQDPANLQLRRDVLGQVARLVVEHKVSLWAYFFRRDAAKAGLIDSDVWNEGCSAVLGDFPWLSLREVLDIDGGPINYLNFLRRFQVTSVGDGASEKCIKILLERIHSRIVQQRQALRSSLGPRRDKENKNALSLLELRETLARLDLGLTRSQIAALMRTASAHAVASSHDCCRSSVDAAGVAARFEIVFQPLAAWRDAPLWAFDVLGFLGRFLWGSASGLPECPKAIARKEFAAADGDGDGLVTHAEFAVALGRIFFIAGGPVHREFVYIDLAKLVDSDGKVNFTEFLAHFVPGDAIAGRLFYADIFEQILSVLWMNKPALLSGCRLFDEGCSGHIQRDHLVKVLHTFNHATSMKRSCPLTDEQIELLVFGDKVSTVQVYSELVDYNRFFNTFQVFDTLCPPLE